MYLTISQSVFTQELIIKKSRFITHLARIHSEAEAQAFIAQIRKEHYRANHNVFAYVLGDNDEIQRMSDDGEPSGTAGVPILEVLKKNQVHDVVAVVTRYFGGIKLGAGGLIRAYAGAPADTIANVGLVERILQRELHFTIGYNLIDKVQYWLSEHQPSIPTINYTDQVELTIAVTDSEVVAVQNALTNLTQGQIKFTLGDEIFAERPYNE